MNKGFVFYDGAPAIGEGGRILGIATFGSRNKKTGPLVQTYIIRADMDPVTAINSGADTMICGDCKHRGRQSGGTGDCYVNAGQSVLAVFKCWKRGGYDDLTANPREIRRRVHGQRSRAGTYGDPAMIPAQAWEPFGLRSRNHTGYTHQWRRPEAQWARGVLMASVDTEAEKLIASIQGWRTFRVKTSDDALQADEIYCPADRWPEGDPRHLTCDRCLFCDGQRESATKSVAIDVHGGAPLLAGIAKRGGFYAVSVSARDS